MFTSHGNNTALFLCTVHGNKMVMEVGLGQEEVQGITIKVIKSLNVAMHPHKAVIRNLFPEKSTLPIPLIAKLQLNLLVCV